MKKLLLLSLVLGVIITSCQQNSKTKSFDDYTQTSSGLYYKFYQQNEGDTPQMMELLDVMLSCSINDTAVMIPENRMVLQMIESMFSGDIFEGLKMMHKGDSASFMVRADSTFITLFGSPMPDVFSVNDMMRFEIRLNDFFLEKHEVKFVWVRGHNGDYYNEMVDSMCTSEIEKIVAKYNLPKDRFTKRKTNQQQMLAFSC